MEQQAEDDSLDRSMALEEEDAVDVWRINPPRKKSLDSLGEEQFAAPHSRDVDESPTKRSVGLSSGLTSPGTPRVPEYGELGDGWHTPGTDVSTASGRAEKAGRFSRSKSQSIAEFRENQMRCMEALRKGVRAAAVAASLRQTSEPAVPVSSSLRSAGRQLSQESVYSDKFSMCSDRMSDDTVVADPMVSMVKSLSIRQYQCYERLLDDLGQLRQEALLQRQEMKELLRRQADEIDELRTRRSSGGCSVAKTFVAAMGVGLGLSRLQAHEGSLLQRLAHFLSRPSGKGVRVSPFKHKDKAQDCPKGGDAFVLLAPRKHFGWRHGSLVGSTGPRRVRRAKQLRPRQHQ